MKKRGKRTLAAIALTLVILGGIFAYRHFTYHPVCMGIDVSHHNNILSGNAPETYKNLDSLQFLIAKSTQGSGFVDDKFEKHRRFARQNGWKFGAYHFLTREHDASEQFENFRKAVGKDIDIIPCLDIERYDEKAWGRSEARKQLKEWNERCKAYYGVYPIVYCNEFYRIAYFHDMPNKFWISNWVTKPLLPCAIHQYTSNDETLDYDYLPFPIESILMGRE